jgi:hypothetical protein
MSEPFWRAPLKIPPNGRLRFSSGPGSAARSSTNHTPLLNLLRVTGEFYEEGIRCIRRRSAPSRSNSSESGVAGSRGSTRCCASKTRCRFSKPNPCAQRRNESPERLPAAADEFEVSALIMDRRHEIWRDPALARRLESRAAVSMATPKLHSVDFAPERRSEDDCCALSGDDQILWPADARGA